jgi:threonylcarbamoyladenosine tRNA methylthiotransferase MtaB
VPELPRLRLSSIDAAEVDVETAGLFATEKRLMPHLHLSLQAGDDMILKRMKRRHNRADILRFTERMRTVRPDVVFGADIIAGFPTETEEMFQNTLNIVGEAGLTYLHVFPYSARTGTPAAKMPQVVKAVRKERAERLRNIGKERLSLYLNSLVGTKQSLVIEQNGLARTEGFATARFDTTAPQGSVINAVVSGVENHHLLCA